MTTGRCQVVMVHPDGSEEQCIRAARHVRADTDHVDTHGHHAPVLVSEASVEEVCRVAEARSLS